MRTHAYVYTRTFNTLHTQVVHSSTDYEVSTSAPSNICNLAQPAAAPAYPMPRRPPQLR